MKPKPDKLETEKQRAFFIMRNWNIKPKSVETILKHFDKATTQAKLDVLRDEFEWLNKYFKNQEVYLPDLDVKATEIVKERISQIQQEIKSIEKYQLERICEHEWEEDENFKDGVCMMFFDDIGNVRQETRVICKKCGDVNYVKKEINKIEKQDTKVKEEEAGK